MQSYRFPFISQESTRRGSPDDSIAISSVPVVHVKFPLIRAASSEEDEDSIKELPVSPVRRRLKPAPQSYAFDRKSGNPKPWMHGRTTIRRDRKSYFVFLFGICLGLGGGLYLIISAFIHVEKHQWCLVLQDDFNGSELNTSTWLQEERVGGGESADFTWFTNHNTYIDNGNLFIVPSLTNQTLLPTDYALLNSTVLQLGSGCSSIHQSDCRIIANSFDNETLVIPPIQSGMISTRNKVNIKYGRVVVRAKMPTGDWIWPQISLVPATEEYGPYPGSGLISVFETRGNQAQYRLDQLNNEMVCGLHWGPASAPTYDRFYRTQGLYKVYRNFFNQRYYEFGVDWTPNQISMWVNSRVRIAFNINFGGRTFFDLGQFGYSYTNGTIIPNPWISSTDPFIAPFDQAFYLRIAVLAGGLDGYFADSLPNKPWQNTETRPAAMSQFWSNVGSWLPTWPSGDKIRERGLAIDSVAMYQMC